MLVLLPPPRYPAPQDNAYTFATTSGGLATPTMESQNNGLTRPVGPEYQLAVGEGTYVLRDDIHLATPPLQPSDIPALNPNPLATTPAPPTAGVKLSLSIVSPRRVPPQLYKLNAFGSTRPDLSTYSIKESEKETRTSYDTSSDGAPQQLLSDVSGKAPAFGEYNSLLNYTSGKEGLKRRKPKSNIVKSNSSLISRVILHDSMNKRIQEHNPEGLFVFANFQRGFQWLDLSSPSPSKADHIIKVLFNKAHMLCHHVNTFTTSPNHLDVVMGASSADIIWFEAFSQKYNRINKNGIIHASPISEICWVPGSENIFLASHMDGTLIFYDKERDDAVFISENNNVQTHDTVTSEVHTPLKINKSVNSKNQKANPVASWKISNHRINGFAFSPDCRHIAVVSEDGSLHIVNYLKEQLTDVYTSYYGGLMCICWSPDGKYVLTGGQDDLVSIWSLGERRIVARCPGHQSWVTAVAFDPWRCDDRNYRFGSVGEDRRLLLWDLNVGMLHRPKTASVRQRSSMSSHLPMSRNRAESQATTRPRSNSNLTSNSVNDEVLIEHPVESRTRTAELPPVMSKIVGTDPMSWIGFEEDCIITACTQGHIRIWDRPREGQ